MKGPPRCQSCTSLEPPGQAITFFWLDLNFFFPYSRRTYLLTRSCKTDFSLPSSSNTDSRYQRSISKPVDRLRLHFETLNASFMVLQHFKKLLSLRCTWSLYHCVPCCLGGDYIHAFLSAGLQDAALAELDVAQAKMLMLGCLRFGKEALCFMTLSEPYCRCIWNSTHKNEPSLPDLVHSMVLSNSSSALNWEVQEPSSSVVAIRKQCKSNHNNEKSVRLKFQSSSILHVLV
jgi:hypothetical protein